MKKLIIICVVLCLGLMTCGAMAEQTASAVLDREGNGILVMVDLTGGWSVEFASGALYLYSGEIREGREADAIGMTLEKEVYDEYMAEAEKSETRRDLENGVCYTSDDSTYYLIAVGDSAYFMLDVSAGKDGDAILARLDLASEGSASQTPEADTKINCLIEEGSFIIQIDDPEGDLGWVADDMAQDASVVKLYDADLIEDTFVVRYDPVSDGKATVAVRHYAGVACDEMITWDLTVENGAVKAYVEGTHRGAADDAELDPSISGEWVEQETQFTQLSVEKNPVHGWDVEAVSPLTHGAYVFKTTIYYDCDVEGFVYDKGKFWDVPITDSDNTELGEAKIAGSKGTFTFGGDSIEEATLTWHDDGRTGDVVFVRAEGL